MDWESRPSKPSVGTATAPRPPEPFPTERELPGLSEDCCVGKRKKNPVLPWAQTAEVLLFGGRGMKLALAQKLPKTQAERLPQGGGQDHGEGATQMQVDGSRTKTTENSPASSSGLAKAVYGSSGRGKRMEGDPSWGTDPKGRPAAGVETDKGLWQLSPHPQHKEGEDWKPAAQRSPQWQNPHQPNAHTDSPTEQEV